MHGKEKVAKRKRPASLKSRSQDHSALSGRDRVQDRLGQPVPSPGLPRGDGLDARAVFLEKVQKLPEPELLKRVAAAVQLLEHRPAPSVRVLREQATKAEVHTRVGPAGAVQPQDLELRVRVQPGPERAHTVVTQRVV